MMPNNKATPSLPISFCRRRGLALSLVVALLHILPGVFLQADESAPAQNRRFHIGIGVPMDFLQASWDKTVDNTSPATLVPEPRRGKVFQEKSSDDSTGYGIGVFAGYRVPLLPMTSLFLTGEIDIAYHQGTVEGELLGTGVSPGRNQLGENWPGQWTFENQQSYGLTFKLGGDLGGALRLLDTSFYGLGGLRFNQAEFANYFTGCFSLTPCSSATDTPNFTSGSVSRDLGLLGWTAGFGIEKMIGKRIALQIEARYTQYGNEDWVTPFDDVGVAVPNIVEADNFHLVFRFAWYR